MDDISVDLDPWSTDLGGEEENLTSALPEEKGKEMEETCNQYDYMVSNLMKKMGNKLNEVLPVSSDR